MTKPAEQHRSERLRFRETALASGLLDDAQLVAAEKEIGLVIDSRTADPEAWDRAVS